MFTTKLFSIETANEITCQNVDRWQVAKPSEIETFKSGKSSLDLLTTNKTFTDLVLFAKYFSFKNNSRSDVESKIKEIKKSLENHGNEIDEPDASKFIGCEERLPEVIATLEKYQKSKLDFLMAQLEYLRALRKHLDEEIENKTTVRPSEFVGKTPKNDSANPINEPIKLALSELTLFQAKVKARIDFWQNDTDRVIQEYKDTKTEVNSIAEKMLADIPRNSPSGLKIYSSIQIIWRNLVDEGLLTYEKSFSGARLISPPHKTFDKDADPVLLDQYEKTYESVQVQLLNLSDEEKKALETQLKDYFQILAKVSEIRARVLTRLDLGFLMEDAGRDFFDDVFREALAVPVRFIGITYARYLQISGDLGKGLIGFWNLLQKFFVLISLFFIPFFARKATKYSAKFLDEYRVSLIKKPNRRINNIKLALIVQRSIPYIPWIIYYLVVIIIDSILVGTIYEDLRIIIPIVKYIFLYKMFRFIIADAIFSLQASIQINSQDTKHLVERTTKIVGRFYLISFTIVHLTEYTVDQGLIFGQLSALMSFFGLLICGYAAMGWENIIIPAAQNYFNEKISGYMTRFCSGRLKMLACLPTLILILIKIFLDSLWDSISEWEISKKYFAKLYRRKIESLGNENKEVTNKEIPESYQNLFSYGGASSESFFIQSNQHQYNIIKKEINAWATENEDDHSMVIFGEKGIGKTTLLDRIEKEHTDFTIIRTEVPPKICDAEALSDYITGILKIENTENIVRAVLEYNKQAEKKTVILVDDAHNLFIGKVGGFEALKSFINIVNLNTTNIFWVVVFNEYSWAYLKGVLGNTEYFRTEIHLDSWSDKSIRDLILTRHSTTQYKLSFDRIILASRSSTNEDQNALAYAEEQFFRLLWEQSNGNPRVALFLWLNCLSLWHGHTLKVGLPERPRVESLAQIGDVGWFVLSAIVNHENATRKEISASSNLSIGEVSYAVKIAMERKLVHKSKGNRFRLGFTYQYDLIRQLKAKNFIYGLD